MSALAQHLLRLGHTVSGTDREDNLQTEKLRKLGATVTVGHNEDAVRGAELVVHTSAVHEDNCELVYAREHGIPTILREELLGTIFNGFGTRIAVCGTHGKTTVTAMLHHVLERCGVSHAAFIGGEYDGNNYFPGDKVVVAEACEYNRSFLRLYPSICVCVNVEHDHPDCYPTPQDTEAAFKAMFAQSEKVVLPDKYKNLCHKAFLCGEDVVARNVKLKDGCAAFEAVVCGDSVGKVALTIPGKHNVSNALSVIAVAHTLHLPMLQVLQAIGTFRGVDRRWTLTDGPCTVVCDYAHHPTEIDAAVQTAKSVVKKGGKIICVFQPHTYSRTQTFFCRFADCFAPVDEVIYLPIYSAREQPIRGITSRQLCHFARLRGINARYYPTFSQAAQYLLRIATKDDLILLVGAGDVNTLAELLR